jgi:hypothetical protein
VRQVLAYRGWTSPEALDVSYRPDRAPVGGATIRRIIDQTWERDDELTMLRLAGMLRLPPRTLLLVVDGDAAGLSRLEFTPDDEGVRQLILDIIREATDPPKRARRRNTG